MNSQFLWEKPLTSHCPAAASKINLPPLTTDAHCYRRSSQHRNSWTRCTPSQLLEHDNADEFVVASSREDAIAQIRGLLPEPEQHLDYRIHPNTDKDLIMHTDPQLVDFQSIEELQLMLAVTGPAPINGNFWGRLRKLGFSQRDLTVVCLHIDNAGRVCYKPQLKKRGEAIRFGRDAKALRLRLVTGLIEALRDKLPSYSFTLPRNPGYATLLALTDPYLALYNQKYGKNSHRLLPEFIELARQWSSFRDQPLGALPVGVGMASILAWYEQETALAAKKDKRRGK